MIWAKNAAVRIIRYQWRWLRFALLAGPFLLNCRPNATRSDTIHIDGSSTVFPLTEAVVEEYISQNPDQKITVGISGTGGGFQKFCRNEAPIIDASRTITGPERSQCQQNNVRYLPVEVAYDGLAIVVNPTNTWATSITVAELRRLWEPAAQGKITRWNQIRSNWPNTEIHLFGAGVASGTYDYFTQVIVGKQHASRGDYTASEDDNVLVQGVATDRLALGFFGLAYVEENKEKLKIVSVDDENDQNGKGPVRPTIETVRNKTYAPLTRPLFLYINQQASRQPALQAFVTFYLNNIARLAQQAGYVPLSPSESSRQHRRFDQFAGIAKPLIP